MQDPVVIVVGMRALPLHKELLRALEEHGVQVIDLAGYEDLSPVLAEHRKAAIVVHSQHRHNGAHHVLKELSAAIRSSPVLVVVDHSDWGEYNELMADGAVGYYETSEGPRKIGAAIEHIAMKSAS